MAAVQAFVTNAKDPCVVEPGQDAISLLDGSYEITIERGSVVLQAWNATDNLVRRIVRVQDAAAGRMDLEIQRFGKRSGVLHLVDRAHRNAAKTTGRAGRLQFREWFHRALMRYFAGWRVRDLSCEADLEHSLSPAYSRAYLTKGSEGWAAIGVAPDGADVDGCLSFGLIWLDYLRRRDPRVALHGLALFLPEGHEATTCLRVRHLDRTETEYAVFVYADGWEQRIDIQDAGNLRTALPACERCLSVPAWMEGFERLQYVERLELGRDHVSWRVHGLEFASWDGGDLRFGIDSKRKGGERHRAEIYALANELARARSADAGNRNSLLYAAAPERWLESQIRENLPGLDAGLLPGPIYGQVPALAGITRGVVDLLACGLDGRLAVIEVKASEDLHLPLQALDYWIRVRWHAAQGDFTRQGYFDGLPVNAGAPRLLLIAPALCFHPTTETILRFLPSEIEVERIGVAMNWRSELKAVFRAPGCQSPVRCEDRY